MRPLMNATVTCSSIKLINEWREVAAASPVVLGLGPSSVSQLLLSFKVNKHEDNSKAMLIVLKRKREMFSCLSMIDRLV